MYRPEVAFVSKLTGQVYPLVMMLGESPIIDETEVNQLTHGVVYSLVDVTSSRTQDVVHGYNDGDRNDPRTHAAAIANAFEKFGEKANYGEGILVVRIPLDQSVNEMTSILVRTSGEKIFIPVPKSPRTRAKKETCRRHSSG